MICCKESRVKHDLDQLTVDVEKVVRKVYSFFSTSAQEENHSKSFAMFSSRKFYDMSQQDGFLLNPAITHPKQTLTALSKLSEDSTEEDGDIVVYLLFCNNMASIFEEVVKKPESE